MVVLLLRLRMVAIKSAIYSVTCLRTIIEQWSHGRSSPFKGEDGRGMGGMRKQFYRHSDPIPTLALPLKGRGFCGN
jgi:hypothetical protein